MRRLTIISHACMIVALPLAAQSERDFSGSWKLARSRASITDNSVPADAFIRVEQSATAVAETTDPSIGGPAAISVYPLDGRSQKYQSGDLQKSAATKWEGDALLVNIIVSGPSSNYTVFERWSKSRDGNTLTVEREVTRPSGGTESNLDNVKPGFVYFNAGAFSSSTQQSTHRTRPAATPAPNEY